AFATSVEVALRWKASGASAHATIANPIHTHPVHAIDVNLSRVRAVTSSSGLFIAHAWVDDAVGEIGEQVAEDYQHAGDDGHPEQHRIVAVERGLPEELAHAGIGEDRFGDDRAAEQPRQAASEQGD